MPRKKQDSTKQITARLPEMLVDQIDHFVDGEKFRNRSHAIQVMVSIWMEQESAKRKGKQETIFPLAKGKRK
jgi:Arc/MetJ-type ribon-helix-helix transcriptional regulator